MVIKSFEEFFYMSSKVAKNIKISSFFIFWIGIIASVFGGFFIILSANPIGFLVILIGSFISWLFYIMLYGFGQLIENSGIIAYGFEVIQNDTPNYHFNKSTKAEDKIAVLNDLKNKGLITEEEYNDKSENLK